MLVSPICDSFERRHAGGHDQAIQLINSYRAKWGAGTLLSRDIKVFVILKIKPSEKENTLLGKTKRLQGAGILRGLHAACRS